MISIPEDKFYYNQQGHLILVKYRIDNYGHIVETCINTSNGVKRVNRPYSNSGVQIS